MRRRGVSLLEVMFAIGVVAIGLLGVIALFPIALNRVGEGVTTDRARRTGINAVDRFTAHGMNRPDQWVWYNLAGNRQAVGDPQNLSPSPFLLDGPNSGFVIDPQFVAVNGGAFNATNDARLFPYYPRAPYTVGGTTYQREFDPRLRRITLGAQRDATTMSPPPIMRLPHAASIFTGTDDLAFNVPEEENLAPVQVFGSAGPGSTTPASPVSAASVPSGAKRQYEGKISWLATVVPRLDPTTPGPQANDQYLLSIVIFNTRDGSFAMNATNERLVTVDSFFNAGLGGGDVNLEATGTDPVGQLELQRGNWVLLMSTAQPPNPPTTPSVSIFRWYRVVDTEEAPRRTSPTTAERFVTLHGPDWPAVFLESTTGKPRRPTRVAILSNVIAVYQRTIRLETSGTWTY